MEWRLNSLPAELLPGANAVAAWLGMPITEQGIPVYAAAEGTGLSVRRQGETVAIRYGRRSAFFRGLSQLAAAWSGEAVEEDCSFDRLCCMADMSRNAVLNLPAAKDFLTGLAVMGYDALMLYTEDTYEVPEHPYFGYMRGRYTQDELRELDAYAAMLGIELVPCIQTLAHLGAPLRWDAFRPVTDVGDILLADEEETYAVIAHMLDSVAAAFSSRRINLGMDEAFLLGMGRYRQLHGLTDPTDIFLRHLDRVLALCRERGFQPMIWSDMFFRLAYGDYYVQAGEIDPGVRSRVPAELALIYWDYYSTDPAKFRAMVAKHQRFDNPIAFAGGAWKWQGYAPDNAFSQRVGRMQLAVCREQGIREVIVTAWGDNGADASLFSILPTLLLYAEEQYGGAGDARLRRRFAECFGGDWEDWRLLDLPDRLPDMPENPTRTYNPSKYLLFGDPLMSLFDRHASLTYAAVYREHADRLRTAGAAGRYRYLFATLAALCELLAEKSTLSLRIRQAYKAGDKAALYRLATHTIPETIGRLDRFIEALRRQWLAENKPFGLEVQDIRLGGLRERLTAAARRLTGYIAGEYPRIEELEEEPLYYDGRSGDSRKCRHLRCNNWAHMATAGIV